MIFHKIFHMFIHRNVDKLAIISLIETNMAKIALKIQPKSKRNEVKSLNPLVLRIAAEPIDGKANEALISYLSNILDLPKSHITITHGAHIKQKILEIEGYSQKEIMVRLAQARGQLLLATKDGTEEYA